MDVYNGHGEGDTKWKGCAWKLLLFKFNKMLYVEGSEFWTSALLIKYNNYNLCFSKSQVPAYYVFNRI